MKFGVVLSTDTRVVEKHVCHSYQSALYRGRALKRRYPDYVVRVISLLPGDHSEPEDIPLVARANRHDLVGV